MTTKLRPEAMGARIRTLLQTRHLTVAKAAKMCGLPKATFEDYLYGKCLPGAEALAGLSLGLDCSTDWLLFGEGTP